MQELLELCKGLYSSSVEYSQLIFPITVGILLFSELIVNLMERVNNGEADNYKEYVERYWSTKKHLDMLERIFGAGIFLGWLTFISWYVMAVLLIIELAKVQVNVVLSRDVIITFWLFIISATIYLIIITTCQGLFFRITVNFDQEAWTVRLKSRQNRQNNNQHPTEDTD